MNVFRKAPPPADAILAEWRRDISFRSPAQRRQLDAARERSRKSTSARLKRLNGDLGQRRFGRGIDPRPYAIALNAARRRARDDAGHK